MNHTVSDFIIRIKNASLARRKTIVVPLSKMNKEMAAVLIKEKLLSSCKEEVVEGRKMLVVALQYEQRDPAITSVLIISKPSLRVYKKANTVQRGIGTSLISTSLGIMTQKEARKKGIGGELLFTIW